MQTVDLRIGRAVARLRAEAGLSQTQLAERMGVAQGTVSKWEGGAPMAAASVWNVARAIDVPPWLVLAVADSSDCGEGKAPMLTTMRILMAKPTGNTLS